MHFFYIEIVLADIIESSMMEFVPHSENGKVMKQKIYAKKNASTILPAIR
jgi:hypothetical protein